MKVISKAKMIENIVEKWTEQYPDSEYEIREKLQALNPPTEKGITAIIGHRDWTSTICGECGSEKPLLVFFGEEDTWEHEGYSNIEVCTDCMEKARLLTEKFK